MGKSRTQRQRRRRQGAARHVYGVRHRYNTHLDPNYDLYNVMRYALVALLVAGVVWALLRYRAFAGELVLSPELIKRINSTPGVRWHAHISPRWRNIMYGHASMSLGAQDEALPRQDVSAAAAELAADLPESFNGTEQWRGCLHRLVDVGVCGATWAATATEVLADRFCISSGARVNVSLSVEQILLCDRKRNQACLGGSGVEAMRYLERRGVQTSACVPYSVGVSGFEWRCPGDCTSSGVQDHTRYRAASYRRVAADAAAIQRALLTGPVYTRIHVCRDLFAYSHGIYHAVLCSDARQYVGDAAVKLLGWGVADDAARTPFWIAQHHWGTGWGEGRGRFRLLRGVNEAGVEDAVVTVTPLLEPDPPHKDVL